MIKALDLEMYEKLLKNEMFAQERQYIAKYGERCKPLPEFEIYNNN